MSIIERILDANTTLIGFDSENEINVNKIVSLLSGGNLKIIKDRRNVDNITIDIREELRDLSLKQLFNENTLKT